MLRIAMERAPKGVVGHNNPGESAVFGWTIVSSRHKTHLSHSRLIHDVCLDILFIYQKE